MFIVGVVTECLSHEGIKYRKCISIIRVQWELWVRLKGTDQAGRQEREGRRFIFMIMLLLTS